MGAPAKFMFDLDFSEPVGRGPGNAAEIEALVAEAEARGARNGFAAGKVEAASESAQRIAAALAQIAAAATAIAGDTVALRARMDAEAVDVAVAVARKLSAELVAREPIADIMALVNDCLRHLTTTPHLVVRINDALYEDAKGRIEAAAKQCGFAGRLVILADPDIPGGDCKIEWADGGVTSDRAATEAKIGELVDAYLAAHTARLESRS